VRSGAGPARQARPTVNHTYNTAQATPRSKQLLNLELQAILLHYSMPFVTLDVQEANKDCDDSEYATSLTHLAAALVRSPAVHDASALELCEQTLAFRQRVLPADHPDIATSMRDTAYCYSELGRHAEALDLQEQVLELCRRVLPADHPDIATAMLNASLCYFALGRHAESRDVLSADHPNITNTMFKTVKSYSKPGRHTEALNLQKQALAIRRRVLPADHPDIATSMRDTAYCYYEIGRHAEALDLQEQALAFLLRVLPADHPDIATAMLNASSSYYELGRHAEALDHREQALAIRRRVGPSDHPDIAEAMLKTANCYSELGRHAEALDLQEQALAILRRVLPADHPQIAIAMNNTANSYTALERHAEALELCEQTLMFRRRVLSASDPDIARTMLNSANSYYLLGRRAEALDHREQALVFLLRVLPADHPDIATAMLNASISNDAVGRHAEALDHREQTLAIRRRVGPADHPDNAIILFLVALSLANSGTMLQCSWFAHESLRIFRSQFSDSHPRVLHLNFMDHQTARHSNFYGANTMQPMTAPSSDHLRIGRLVRLHGLSAHALNGSQALVFGPEQNGRVPVRLVEARAEVSNAGVGEGSGKGDQGGKICRGWGSRPLQGLCTARDSAAAALNDFSPRVNDYDLRLQQDCNESDDCYENDEKFGAEYDDDYDVVTTTITNTRHLQHLLVKLHLAQQRHKSKASVFSLARAIACQPLATEPLIPAASPCCPAVRANET
jgi:tetratricopeptide (TPR) repeat protein